MAKEVNLLKFKFDEIKKNSFFEKDFNSYGLTSKDIEKGVATVNTRMHPDSKTETITFIFNVIFKGKKEGKEYDLFGIETYHRFKIKDFEKCISRNKDGKDIIPIPLALTLCNLAYSDTRGMLIVSITNPAYSKIYLPVVDPMELIKTLQEEDTNESYVKQ